MIRPGRPCGCRTTGRSPGRSIPKTNGFAGKLPWRGVGWYRKSFKLDRDAGDRVYLDFDGVMAFPKVYVNGKLAGEWDYGYTSFRIDATPFVNLEGRRTSSPSASTRPSTARAGILARASTAK